MPLPLPLPLLFPLEYRIKGICHCTWHNFIFLTSGEKSKYGFMYNWLSKDFCFTCSWLDFCLVQIQLENRVAFFPLPFLSRSHLWDEFWYLIPSLPSYSLPSSCRLSLECHKTAQCLLLLTIHDRCVGSDVFEMLFIGAEMAFLGGCHLCTMVDV